MFKSGPGFRASKTTADFSLILTDKEADYMGADVDRWVDVAIIASVFSVK